MFHFTLSIEKIITLKNARAWVSMVFISNVELAPIAIEKIKILGAVLELPAKQHCRFDQFGPIVLGAEYLSYMKSIETHGSAF